MAELENVRAGETSSDITDRLVRAVHDLKPTQVPSGNESGARRLLNRLRGAVMSALSNGPSRQLAEARGAGVRLASPKVRHADAGRCSDGWFSGVKECVQLVGVRYSVAKQVRLAHAAVAWRV